MSESLNVLITGTSSGFGVLISKTLAKSGHRVFATMRSIETRNAEAAKDLRDWAKQENVSVEVLELDVTSDESVSKAVAHIAATAGPVDVLVNNAGAAAGGPIEAFTTEQILSVLNLNAVGPMRVSQAVLPAMRARRKGLIIVISSTLGRVLPGMGGLYPASKWAIEGLTESLRYQVAPWGVDVAIIEPGSFPSGAFTRSMQAANKAITDEYAALNETLPKRPPVEPLDESKWPDPQEVADKVQALIDMPAGQRPLRTVAGPVFTEGVAEYNEIYERTREKLAESLRRPDQQTTWTRPR